MKKQIFNLFYVLALLTIVTACSDDDDPIDLPVYGDATMTSFGFYVEDNEGVILKDYVAEGITGDFTVSVPDYVDKTALVARFVVSENDTVYVNNVQQESGVTANDFSAPLDYIVSEGTNNTKYTVTVANLPAAVWSLAVSDTTDLQEFSMRVNPVTNVPYLAYARNMDDVDDEKAGVLKLDGDKLVNVGSETISDGRARYLRIAFDSEGAPFISFSDYTNDDPYNPGSTTYSASVMSYNSLGWSYVGNKGVTDGRITYNDVVVKEDGNPMLFCCNAIRSGGILAYRELSVSNFEGSSWNANVAMPGRPASNATYFPTAVNVNGVIYIGTFNNSEGVGTFSVYKYENGTWATITENYLQEGATTGNLRDFDMDVDHNGNVFVCVADDESGADIYRPKVLKYDATAETWSKVGTPIAIDFSTTREFSLAISPVGTPFLMYRDDSKFPVVVSFDEDTQDWTTPTQLDAVESENLYMDFAPNGVAYAAFTTAANGGTMIFKYDIPAE